MKKILASAQPFGFGPVSKLVSIATHLGGGAGMWVAGNGTTLRYAQLNRQNLQDVVPFDFADRPGAGRLVRGFDAAISVMEPRLVYAAVRAGRPVYFFDSLFSFWIASRPLDELAAVARLVLTGPELRAADAFDSLSVHESMLVAHMLATRSYAQVFPGVKERIRAFAELGFAQVHAAGPMIDVPDTAHAEGPGRSRTLVANLGGFTNAFLDYQRRGAYIDIVVRWLTRLAETTTDFDEIIVCSGAFGAPCTREVNGVRVTIGLLPHAELLDRLAQAPVYLASPGLTSLHEAVALSVLPMLLPDQHYGHLINRRRLAHTSFARLGASFEGLGTETHIPADDLEGTLVIAGIADGIHRDPARFDAFADYMDARLSAFVYMPPDETRAHVRELREMLHGTPLSKIIAAIIRETVAAGRVHAA